MYYAYFAEIDTIPQSRPKISHNKAYYSQKTYAFRNNFKAKFLPQKIAKNAPCIDCPCRVIISVARTFHPASRRFGDADNIAKAVLDALTDISILKDDSIVTSLTVEKLHSDTPSLFIEIFAESLVNY